jgi:uncharacterized protein (TIGR03663 family)
LYSLRFNWEIVPYLLLAAIALGMRLWDLGSAAITHDESLHAMYSWYLYQDWPQGYEHMPMMHGPFQFFGTAINFFLFGDSDFTARLLPALFGTALVVLPYFLRRQLGRWGSLAVAIFLAFSPALLYFSRYARTDIYIAFLTLLLVICLWRYLEQRKARYLYFSAAALSLSFCTKEVSYLTVAIFASFLFIVSARELLARVKRRFDFRDLSAPAEYLILLGTLSLPLFAAAIELIPGVDISPGVLWPKVLTVVLLFAISAAIGLRWNWRRWLLSALIFYGIFTLLYTSFFTHIYGFGSGMWNAMDYWIAQQDVARGGQPWYYYFLLLSWYEFLPLLLAVIGAIYYTIKGNLFSRFLVYWAVLSLIIYSLFGEKMPWLSLHMALPMILLGGMFIGRLFQKVDWRPVRAGALRAATALILILLFSFTVHVALQASYEQDDTPPQMLVYAGISADMPRIMDQIEELAKERGEGKELAITVDSPLTWPWIWYLRDYENVDYPNLSAIEQPPQGAVLLLSAGNEQAAQPYLGKYGEGQEFRHRLWFPEEYREYQFFDSDGWRWWWDYLLYRETLGPYWSTEGIAYFPDSSP